MKNKELVFWGDKNNHKWVKIRFRGIFNKKKSTLYISVWAYLKEEIFCREYINYNPLVRKYKPPVIISSGNPL